MNAYITLLFVSFIFASQGIFVKLLHLPPTTFTFFRLAVPTIFLFLFFLLKSENIFAKINKVLLFASLLNAIRLFFYFSAFTYASLGNASLASATGPIFMFIFSSLLLKEKISTKKYVLLVMATIGVIILYSNQPLTLRNSDVLGMTFAIAEQMLYSLSIILFKQQLENYSQTQTVFYQNLVGTFLFLPFLFLNHPFPTIEQAAIASVTCFMIGVVGFILYFSVLKKVSASSISLATLNNIFGVGFGVIIFKEVLTVNMIIGGLLIFMSSFFIRKHL